MGHNSPWPFCRLLKPFEPSLKFYNVTRIPVGVTAHVSSVSYLERAPIRLFAGWPVFRANTCFGLLPRQDSLELPRTDPTHLQSLDTLTRLSDNSLKVRNVFLPRSPDGPWWHLGKQLAATSHPGGPLLSTSLTPPPLVSVTLQEWEDDITKGKILAPLQMKVYLTTPDLNKPDIKPIKLSCHREPWSTCLFRLFLKLG